MDYRLESQIWMQVQQSMPAQDFVEMIDEAFQSFKRFPGYAGIERMHASLIGSEGVAAIREAQNRAGFMKLDDGVSFVSVRATLRAHLYKVLQWHLLTSSCGTGAVVDDHIARDLGL